MRRSKPFNVPGASLIFSHADCLVRPFRALRQDEDFWFIVDQVRLGASMLPVEAPEQFLAVRHRGSRSDRDHTWTQQSDGRTLEVYLHERSLYPGGPDALLPEWALEAYRAVREELLVDVLSDAGQAPTS